MKKEFKIINGDSLEELKKFPDNYFDTPLTDLAKNLMLLKCLKRGLKQAAWNELEEYEDYKKIIENNEDDEEDSKGGTQITLF